MRNTIVNKKKCMKRQKGKSQKQETGSKEHIDCRLIFRNVLQIFTLFVTFHTYVF